MSNLPELVFRRPVILNAQTDYAIPFGCSLANNEMRLILSKLIWRFDIELCDSSRGWIDQKVYMLYEKPPLEIKLHPRSLGKSSDDRHQWVTFDGLYMGYWNHYGL